LREPGSGANVLAVSDLGAVAINLDVKIADSVQSVSKAPNPLRIDLRIDFRQFVGDAEWLAGAESSSD
jgi:hypothetical protein